MGNDWSELTAWIAAIAFVLAAFYLLASGPKKGIPRSWGVLVAWGVVLAFVAALLWSMWMRRCARSFRREHGDRFGLLGWGYS